MPPSTVAAPPGSDDVAHLEELPLDDPRQVAIEQRASGALGSVADAREARAYDLVDVVDEIVGRYPVQRRLAR
jgi:hypothetical protein